MKIHTKMRIISLILTVAMVSLVATPNVSEAASTVNLGTASNFAVLAGSAITNTGSSTINGDIGLHPGPETALTGVADVVLTGTVYLADEVANLAQSDLTTAYNSASGIVNAKEIPTELGGATLKPGAYTSASGEFGITGTLTLDAEGNKDAIFIFKSESSLITASASNIKLINGANSCQVFWVVGSSATLGTNSNFIGTILAQASITVNNGASIQGKLLAKVAVTLDTNVIYGNSCSIGPSDEPPVVIPPVEPIDEPEEEDEEEEEESRIRLEKVVLDEEGNVIENDDSEFTFELFRKVSGNWRSEDTKTIEGNGTVKFRNLNPGTYMIEEINIPDNYYINSDNEIEIRLSEGETEEVEITNIREEEEEVLPVVETPVTPEIPEIPQTPETPVEVAPVVDAVIVEVPEVTIVPSVPVTTTVTGGKLPKTSIDLNSIFFIGAAFILVGVLGLRYRKSHE